MLRAWLMQQLGTCISTHETAVLSWPCQNQPFQPSAYLHVGDGVLHVAQLLGGLALRRPHLGQYLALHVLQRAQHRHLVVDDDLGVLVRALDLARLDVAV